MSSLSELTEKEFHIVCVDDEKDFLRSIEFFLPEKLHSCCHDSIDYNYSFLSDPDEAIHFIQEVKDAREEVVLIISDQKMPGMKGTDFLVKARDISPDSKRVLLTGYAGLESAITAINENLLDKYLTKPVDDQNDFVISLRQLIDSYHLEGKVNTQAHVIHELYNFANELNAIEDFDKTLNYIVSFAANLLDCARISLMLLEENYLRIKASVGIPPEVVGKTSIPVGEYISGKVFANKQAVFISNIEEAPWLRKSVETDYKSFISVPMLIGGIIAQDQTIGVINVTNKNDNKPFTQNDFDTLNFIANTASIAIKNQLNRLNLKKTHLDTIRVLAQAIEAKDDFTGKHCERIEKYAMKIAVKAGLSLHEIENIRYAAILHDVGKIGIHEDILKKPGKLDPLEYEEIKKHPAIGSDIVKGVTFLSDISPIIHHHQERYDGKGYPSGIAGEEIPLGSRIIAVLDTFDAMTSDRHYRKALKVEDAIAELKRCAGTQFDPMIVELFIKIIEEE